MPVLLEIGGSYKPNAKLAIFYGKFLKQIIVKEKMSRSE
jgi:hypothetical protein